MGKKLFLKKELDKYKEKLLKLKEEVMQNYKSISEEVLLKSPQEGAGEISTHTFHLADMANDTFERDLSLNIASSESQILREIEHALKKIEQGNFGICEMCQKPIPKRRLNALPFVRLCRRCQEKSESQE